MFYYICFILIIIHKNITENNIIKYNYYIFKCILFYVYIFKFYFDGFLILSFKQTLQIVQNINIKYFISKNHKNKNNNKYKLRKIN